jgi:phosphohistidine phosphatase SixA
MLRQGGYVIFFRHVTSDVGSDAPAVIVDDCTTQRNMSEAGLRDARAIGQAFRMLNIPVGDVLSSEFCRALETARIAFGRAERQMALNFCCADNTPLSQEERFAWLERALATLPPQGKNTVLVGHGVGIVADLAMGEAAIYAPDGTGRFVRVARVLPSEWMSGVYPPGGMR